MHSAQEAARLRVEITINLQTQKQWNNIIRANEKIKVSQWVATQNISIDTNYRAESSPYNSTVELCNRGFESYLISIDSM